MYNTGPMKFRGETYEGLAIFREIDTPEIHSRRDGERITLSEDDGARLVDFQKFNIEMEG